MQRLKFPHTFLTIFDMRQWRRRRRQLTTKRREMFRIPNGIFAFDVGKDFEKNGKSIKIITKKKKKTKKKFARLHCTIVRILYFVFLLFQKWSWNELNNNCSLNQNDTIKWHNEFRWRVRIVFNIYSIEQKRNICVCLCLCMYMTLVTHTQNDSWRRIVSCVS